MEEEIIRLTKLWYKIVGLDHHKDRDCHWSVYKIYSYGNPATYRVEHAGYIGGDVSEEYGTSEEAHKGLISILKEKIAEEKKWAEDMLNSKENWEEYEKENAKKIIELTKSKEVGRSSSFLREIN